MSTMAPGQGRWELSWGVATPSTCPMRDAIAPLWPKLGSARWAISVPGIQCAGLMGGKPGLEGHTGGLGQGPERQRPGLFFMMQQVVSQSMQHRGRQHRQLCLHGGASGGCIPHVLRLLRLQGRRWLPTCGRRGMGLPGGTGQLRTPRRRGETPAMREMGFPQAVDPSP